MVANFHVSARIRNPSLGRYLRYFECSGQCARRDYGHDSFVCVCDASFCDEAGVVTVPPAGTYTVYTSTRDDLRLEPTYGDMAPAQGRQLC
jgi:hypothetical protein